MPRKTYTSQHEEGGLRPFATIEPAEWAKLHKARSITDPAKLAALVPTCNQPWRFPLKHSPTFKGDSVEFTFAELRHVPGAPARLPNLTTPIRAPKSEIPPFGSWKTTEDYIRVFESKNNLVQAPIAWVKMNEPEETEA